MGFEEWFDEELPQLIRLATALCGSPDTAQDLVQDVAIKVQQRWERLAVMDHRDAYVRRMLVNEHLSVRRKFARVVLRSTVQPSHPESPQFADIHAERAALRHQLDQLPPRQRAVIVLRYFQDADDTSIAQILGCRPSTVRSHLTRALARLRVSPLRDDQPRPADNLQTRPNQGGGERDSDAFRR